MPAVATNCVVTPLTNPVPVTMTETLVMFLVWVAGLSDVIVGAALTVNTFVAVAAPVSGFVTVTLPAPRVAPEAMVMFAVSDVALLKVVELTVMPSRRTRLAPR